MKSSIELRQKIKYKIYSMSILQYKVVLYTTCLNHKTFPIVIFISQRVTVTVVNFQAS